MKFIKILFVLLLFSFSGFGQQLELEQIAGGFSRPVDITHAGDARLFIVERDGRIKIIDENGSTLGTSFLDIRNQVLSGSSNQSERGLLGLAFHPDYATNGQFFINYINNSGNTIVSKFQVSTADPNVADASSEEVIMNIDQPFGNHNGGCLKFGPDGYLYIGMGDGGSANDPGNRSQNPQNLLGKMLRIDIDNGTPYGIPADNPFVGDASVLDEIWAIGLRNPWRYSFDRETGDFWIGDVGQGQWEEIDYEPANSTGGFNYGWRCYEGDATFNTSGCEDAANYRAPLLDYNHNGFTHCSVTGGFVYRGCDNPDLYGHYIYADYCSGQFWSIVSDGAGGWNDQAVGSLGGDVSTFGEDIDGELYTAGLSGGIIYKVNSANAFSIDVEQTDNTLTGPAGYDTYQWSLEGMAIAGATAETYEITENGAYTLEVSTASGCTYTSEAFTGVVGIEDLESFDAFSVNPNPFTETLSVNMEVNAATDVTIEVMDINGKLLHSKVTTVNGSATEVLNLNNLSAGVYFVHLKTEEGTLVQKVVKE